MRKKLTITVDEEVYDGLHRVIGRRHISRFLNELASRTWWTTLSRKATGLWLPMRSTRARRPSGSRA